MKNAKGFYLGPVQPFTASPDPQSHLVHHLSGSQVDILDVEDPGVEVVAKLLRGPDGGGQHVEGGLVAPEVIHENGWTGTVP